MDLLEQNQADARLRREHAQMLAALKEVQDDISRARVNNVVWPSTQRMIAKAIADAEAPQSATVSLLDGGGPFDAAVDRVIAHVDRHLDGGRDGG